MELLNKLIRQYKDANCSTFRASIIKLAEKYLSRENYQQFLRSI